MVEDAAQSQGATRHGRGAGTFGNAAGTSFYPGKNLGAYGEGGALTTNDDNIAKHARILRDHAQSQRYHHDEIGYNYRMTNLQAALGVGEGRSLIHGRA